MKDASIQERTIDCIRRLALGICNEPHRCSYHVHNDGQFPRIAFKPCRNDYAILHGSDGRQTNAFMALAQRGGVQYELIDCHGVEGEPHKNSSYLNTKVSIDDALALIEELCFLLLRRQVRLTEQPVVNNGQQRGELKVRIQVDRDNRDEMADVALIADLVYPYSWNQLGTLIKVRPGEPQRRKTYTAKGIAENE